LPLKAVVTADIRRAVRQCCDRKYKPFLSQLKYYKELKMSFFAYARMTFFVLKSFFIDQYH